MAQEVSEGAIMRTRRVIEESDLVEFEKNMKRIKNTVGGGVERHVPTLSVARKDGKRVIRGSGTANPLPRCVAGSNPAPSPQYRSKWEAAYASKLELEKRAGIIKAYWHEPFSLWLPGKVRYKPDFLVQYFAWPAGCLEIVEVKGWSKNLRDGKIRLKIAAAIYSCFVWRMVWMKKGGGFDGEYL